MTQCEHKGELEHRRVKQFYARTNKIKFARGISKQQHWERLLYKLQQKAQDARDTDSHPIVNFSEQEVLPQCSPESQYQISDSHRLHWDLTAWLHKNRCRDSILYRLVLAYFTAHDNWASQHNITIMCRAIPHIMRSFPAIMRQT